MSELPHDLERAAGTPRAGLDLDAVHARATTRARHRRAFRATGVTSAAVLVVLATVFTLSQRGDTTNVEQPAHPGSSEQGGGSVSAPSFEPGWTKLPSAPISARRNAVTAWTGSQMLVFGGLAGLPDPTCPMGPQRPACDRSAAPAKFFGDGAAYDPATNAWHSIAPLPDGFATAESTNVPNAVVQVLDGKVYVLGWDTSAPTTARLVAYDPAGNTWSRPAPIGATSPNGWALAGFDHKLVAYAPNANPTKSPVRVYDPATNAWSNLPTDPMVTDPSTATMQLPRQMIGLGSKLYVFASTTSGSTTDQSMSPSPAAEQVAVFDGHRWKRFSHPTNGAVDGMWTATGDHFTMINLTHLGVPEASPSLKSPAGLSFDPTSGTFATLPNLPASLRNQNGTDPAIVGNRQTTAVVSATASAMLDPTADSWTTVQGPTDQPHLADLSVSWAGRQLFVWGGWQSDSPGQVSLSGQGWIWTPGARDSTTPSASHPTSATMAPTTTTTPAPATGPAITTGPKRGTGVPSTTAPGMGAPSSSNPDPPGSQRDAGSASASPSGPQTP